MLFGVVHIGLVALPTQAVALNLYLPAVGIMAMAARYTLLIHL